MNSGLGSIRGARMAEMSYSPVRNTELQRLTDPMVWRYGQMQPTSWEDALDLVARVTAAVINEQGEDGLFVSAFDHGGAGGGYENTWGTGKLYFERHEDQEHPHPQPPGLQFRSPRHARHGRRRAQQLLRGCRARRHHLRGRHQRARDPDQLLPEPLGPEPARHLPRQEERASCRTSRTSRPGSSSSIRGAR